MRPPARPAAGQGGLGRAPARARAGRMVGARGRCADRPARGADGGRGRLSACHPAPRSGA
eukprot:7590401-Lingulodinium_polyedra.AAC.1